jgi:hypothetical protein
MPKSTEQYHIQGSLAFDYGLPAANLTVRLYNTGFAGEYVKLDETKTDGQGYYVLSYDPPAGGANLELRVLDAKNNEVAISSTKYNAQKQETLNLVVPARIRPLASEFQRFSLDMDKHIDGFQKLGQAKEDSTRQDLTLMNRSTGWDARLLALAATAAQQAPVTGLGQDILYALYRTGLPTDPEILATVSSATVQKALTKANQAGIVRMNKGQILAAATSFQNFAVKTRLTLKAPGALSIFGDLLQTALKDSTHQAAFADLYFSQASTGADLWKKAADLKIPPEAIDSLRLQGKFLYLTFNNAPLTQKIQEEIGSIDNLSQLAEKDYYTGAAWKVALTNLAKSGEGQSLEKLIPPAYGGKTTADKLEAYAADLARKVRLSFPTHVTARMIDNQEIQLHPDHAPKVAAFLRSAASRGFELGLTPLNSFLRNHPECGAALDAPSEQSLKTLLRLYQVTPSPESFQAAMKLGFTSAHEIASYPKDKFMQKYESAFPSVGEASLVYSKAQQVSSVTFNFFSMAKQLDSPPVYSFSASADSLQNAKNAIIQQFPTMESLFGSMDFCECEDCRSVLSPAAYLVELLEFLRKSAPNRAGYTPLDVLIGKDIKVPGRRPDLAALHLTCENTNTAMPYIDLVNEILEYFISHNNKLDVGAAYDTGDAHTADLTAEPQHVLPAVYNNNLKKAVFPLNLPFDLWIETVRGFFNYYKTPLAQVLDILQPVNNLELFTDGNSFPYYRAQIFAESLGLAPAEVGVLTMIDPVSHQPSVSKWFQLYGYADENTALNGQKDPTDPSQYLIPPLKSAKNLARRLGLSYQELTDLVTTGFLNPSLNALLFQFKRFGISMDDAFSYTGQPGYVAMSGKTKADFEAILDGISQRYKKIDPASTFNARTWISGVLPAKYSEKVLVLKDPDSGCSFSTTTVQYANGSAAKPLDFLKLNLFVRLWKKLGWTLDETDRALQLFFPSILLEWTNAGFAAAFSSSWKTALVYLAHLNDLATQLNPALGRVGLLPLWANLPTQGVNPLYAQLFLTPSVLNSDGAFDDPAGQFPWSTADPLATHQTALQGVLSLTADEFSAILADAASDLTMVITVVNGKNVKVPQFSLTNLSILYRYSLFAKCLQLSVSDLIALKALSGLNPFQAPGTAPLALLKDDLLFTQLTPFLKLVAVVQGSGFTVEDLQYLLRHQFDPVGKYQQDPNAVMALVQSVATGLRQIQAQNTVPSDLTGLSQDLLEQKLSGLFPARILKVLFSLLAGAQTYQASQGSVAPGGQIDPVPFVQETALSLSYDATTQTQTLSYKGVLLDWQKARLLQINNSPLFSGLLNAVQQQAQASLNQSLGDILGVWASLVEYEAVQTGVAISLAAGPLTLKDPAVSLSYDQADQLQRLAYRGVLTDAKRAALAAVDASPVLANLLNEVQQQALPAYQELIGTLLSMWTNVQVYQATQGNVAPNSQIDPAVFTAYPEIQVSYEPTTKVQTLTYRGVLTDANRVQLAGLVPASAVLSDLLQIVRNQAVAFFQAQATDLLTVTPVDLDHYSQLFLAIDDSKKQKRVKEELVKVFLPLLARKLSRQLVIQTIAANIGSDASLTAALVTDAGLLTDPSNPGKSLLRSFLTVGQQGVGAAYYASSDGSGKALATGIAATADCADPTNPNAKKAGTGSVHFEGYLVVPTDGPYRFFAKLGNTNAQARLQMDSPDPTALFKNPIIQHNAGKDNDEASQFVLLKGGAPYHFTLDFRKLGAGGASMLIQGENLPKGPLNQTVLYPQEAVSAFLRARILLSKVLQIIQTMRLNEREVSYLTANAAQFNNLRLSALPTQASDDAPIKAAALFSQFLTLADYADLRRETAGGTDGLVGVFENVGRTFTEKAISQDSNQDPGAPWRRLADLTRRDPKIVRDVAIYFGLIQEKVVGTNRQVTAVGDFANNKGLRRIWQALQLARTMGIPIGSLTAATVIASPSPPGGSPTPDVIAANLKNAVKARYNPDTWRPIAQAVFDQLRRKKRDALVAFIVNALRLENSNQLFEYFLVDPGMEPVVQTSRLRLALSSVQTFIQRCLLDLENGNIGNPERNVSPGAIDSEWWEWMKRYRIWEANRKIFLFPENWMEPELRLDKSDLFQALESALLQGDVTRDLVEDAFLAYLKGLEVRARLDIVGSYLEQDATHPGVSTLHVIGRTYGKPHKYFYRTYANQVWSAWEAVTPDIEGDHVIPVFWRGRLNLFWLTFAQRSQSKAPPQDPADTTHLANLSFSQLAGKLDTVSAQKQVQVQLNWSEYFQGKWSDRISSDITRSEAINVLDDFDPSTVYVHVSKETVAGGIEGAVRIHLDFPKPDYHTFRVTSKNCDPAFSDQYWEPPPPMPYTVSGVNATLHTGSGELEANFVKKITDDKPDPQETEKILRDVNSFALLTCANPVSPPFLPPNEPLYQEVGGLVSPFFYKDTSDPNTRDELAFFVQPSLTETTIPQWKGWAISPAMPDPKAQKFPWWEKIPVAAQVPQFGPVDPGHPEYSIFPMQPSVDWITYPKTAVSYGERWIGEGGGITMMEISPATAAAKVTPTGQEEGRVSSPLVGRQAASGGLILVSSQGLTQALLQIMNTSQKPAIVKTSTRTFNHPA